MTPPRTGQPQPRRAETGPDANHSLPARFFAEITDDPLGRAFPGRLAPHAAGSAAPVAPDEVAAEWERLAARPRRGPSVAYVHVPFCETHCLFCGFYQNRWRPEAGPPYVDAVLAQVAAGAGQPWQAGGPLRAVYLGGGTPTALAARDLARLVEGLRRHLPLAPDCEITLEGRISGFDAEKARAAFDAGVNRVSLGVQSFDETVRRRLGRRAGRAEAMRRLEELVAADCGAIVIDLIYGLPGQSRETLRHDVRTAAALGLDGLDLYSLKAIPGTPLKIATEKGKLVPAPPEALGHFYADGAEEMDRAGWEALSTTHWRRGTRERSVYNTEVKTGAHCLAFGAGAGGSLDHHGFRIATDLDAFRASAPRGTSALLAGMTRPARNASAHDAIKAGMERGRLDPAAVGNALAAGTGAERFEAIAAPLLAQWADAGLVAQRAGAWHLSLAGRFWQVAMTTRLIAWTDLHTMPRTERETA